MSTTASLSSVGAPLVAPTGGKKPKDNRTKAKHERIQAFILRVSFLLVAAALWEILARVGVIDARFASYPTAILQSSVDLLTDPKILGAIGETLYSVLAAFVIGTSLGMLVGVSLGLNQTLRSAYFPVVMLIMGLPKSVFLPVIILFFGLGTEPGIVFASILTFVHVTVNVIAGVDMVEKRYYNVAKAFGASSWQRFMSVIIPGATPGIFAGLWHGIRNGFIGIVIAQMFVSTAGIGYYVRLYSNNFQTDDAMALVIIMAVLVIVSGTVWNLIEKRLTRWRE